MISRIVIVGFGLGAVVWGVWLHWSQNQFAGPPEARRSAETVVASGIMKRDELNRLLVISAKGTGVTPNEAGIVISDVESHHGSGAKDMAARSIALVSLIGVARGPLSIQDHERVYKIGLSCLGGNVGEISAGAVILGRLQDKRAIPFLLPYVNNPDSNVQKCVKYGLKQLGVKAS
jgi:hypothetical protein